MERFAGIDISRDFLDLALWPEEQTQRFANSVAGISDLVEKLVVLDPTLVAYEPMGPMARPLVEAMAAADIRSVAINPWRMRSFARALNRRAKTDRLDALTIAEFAGTMRPTARESPNAVELELHDLVARRRQLTEIRKDEKIRSSNAGSRLAEQSIDRHLAWITGEIDRMDEIIERKIDSRLDWKQKRELLLSFKGMGPVVSAALVADLPELGLLDRGQIAALAGLAPIPRESGLMVGTRRIKGGRKRVRSALFMCSISAAHFNPVVKRYYQRLRDGGKPPKVARVAVMRKILVILNAMVRDGEPWRDPAG